MHGAFVNAEDQTGKKGAVTSASRDEPLTFTDIMRPDAVGGSQPSIERLRADRRRDVQC